MNRREQAIDAAARARYEQAGPVPKWDDLPEMYRDGWRRGLEPIVDAVLAVPCDCAERLDAEAERMYERRDSRSRAWGDECGRVAEFLRGES